MLTFQSEKGRVVGREGGRRGEKERLLTELLYYLLEFVISFAFELRLSYETRERNPLRFCVNKMSSCYALTLDV